MRPTRNVVLTGASRGLGLEFVRRYLDRGDRVLATCRRPEHADALRELAGRHGDRAVVAPCDVADPDACDALADRVPWERVDVLVLNAGVAGGADDALREIDFHALQHAFQVNAVAPVRIVRALWRHLGEGSRIAAISSLMGSIADNGSGGRYGYRMSKAALNMAVRNLGHECGPRGIVVCALHPGWVRTDMGGEGAPLSTDESVAAMVATIDALRPEHGGAFLDRDGSPLPW